MVQKYNNKSIQHIQTEDRPSIHYTEQNNQSVMLDASVGFLGPFFCIRRDFFHASIQLSIFLFLLIAEAIHVGLRRDVYFMIKRDYYLFTSRSIFSADGMITPNHIQHNREFASSQTRLINQAYFIGFSFRETNHQ